MVLAACGVKPPHHGPGAPVQGQEPGSFNPHPSDLVEVLVSTTAVLTSRRGPC